MTTFEIKEIMKSDAEYMIKKFHYSKTMPRLNKIFLGGVVNSVLVAVMTLGWGVQPKATIKKIFPSLDTKDYFEIGKLCLDEKMPRNSESQFISRCLFYVRKNFKNVKLVYTWADGMLGKIGYVYQASNFLYGGFIWTDSYFSKAGEKFHIRSIQNMFKDKETKYGRRPTKEQQKKLGIQKYYGKQFRYCYFLCTNKERKRLLKESLIEWGRKYPKEKDAQWKTDNGRGIEFVDKPLYTRTVNAKEVSRAKRMTTCHERQVQLLHFA